MSSGGGMVRNTAWLLLGDIVAKIAGLAFVVLVARVVGRAEYGYFTFGYSFAALVLLVGRWGLSAAIQQEIASDGERVPQVMVSALAFLAIVGVIALGVVYTLSPLFVEGTEAYWTIVIVGFALLLDEFTVLTFDVFNALEKMRYPAIILMLNRIGSTLLTVGALLLHKSVIAVSIAYLIGSLGALIGASVLVRRYLPPLRFSDITRDSLRWHLRFGSSLGIASFLNAAVFRADALMLQGLKGPVTVGLYGAAYRFFESFLFVAWSLATVLFPRAIRAGASGESRSVYFKVCSVMLSFYLPLALGTPFVADWLVVGLFSEKFAESARAVEWLMTGGLFYSFAYVTRMAMIALDRRKVITWVAGLTLLLNLAANLLLIPTYSFVGAAAATFIASVFEATVLVWYFFRYTERGGEPKLMLVPVGAGAVMAAALLLLNLRDLGALLVAPVVYAAAWYFFAHRFAPELTAEIRKLSPRQRRVEPT